MTQRRTRPPSAFLPATLLVFVAGCGLAGAAWAGLHDPAPDQARPAIFDEPLATLSDKVDTIVVDLRPGSPHFGYGLESADITDQLRKSAVAEGNYDRMMLRADAEREFPRTAIRGYKPYVDLVILGDRVGQGPQDELARIAGLWKRDADLEVVRVDGAPALDTTRLQGLCVSEAGLENFMAYHELGHGVDALMRDATSYLARQETLSPAGYIDHVKESYADTFATLMMARRFGDTAVAQDVAAARAIGTVVWAPQHIQALNPSSSIDRLELNGGAIYYTTPAIDAALRWIRGIGLEKLRAMAPAELVEQAHALVNQVRTTPKEYERFTGAIADIRLDGARLVPGPKVEKAFVARLEAASARLGFAFRPGDLPDIADFRPSYEMDMAKILAGDLAVGALLLSVERNPHDRFETAHLLEPDGSLTDVRVLANGDVIRLDASGQGIARAGRPAYAAASSASPARVLVNATIVNATVPAAGPGPTSAATAPRTATGFTGSGLPTPR